MKRVRPDPKNVYVSPRPLVAPQPQCSILALPPEIIGLVLQCLRFKDVASFSQTCEHFYKSIPKNEGIWITLFQKHFPNLPRFEPLLSWRTECELQRRCTRNIMTGVHSFHTIPIGEIDPGLNVTVAERPKACSFALDEGGNILIGYENGAIVLLDPKTGENELVLTGKPSPIPDDSIRSLICKEGLYIAGSQLMAKGWDINTKKMLFDIERLGVCASIKHLKLINGKLLIGMQNGEMIHIRDPRSNTCLAKILLQRLPKEIVLCGNIFVASFADNTLLTLNIETRKENILNLTYSSRICEHTENSFFLAHEKDRTFFDYCLDNPLKFPCVRLWTKLGIPSGFKGGYAYNSSLCSLDELSQLFHKVLAQQFDLWDRKKRNEITNAIPVEVSKDVPCVFHRGKIYYFCSDKEAIICLDFTASHQAILQQLAQMLKESVGNLEYATAIMQRMPESVANQIIKNYSELLPPPQTQHSESLPVLGNDKLLELVKNMTVEELSKLIEAQTKVIAVCGFSEEELLRQAILKYLES